MNKKTVLVSLLLLYSFLLLGTGWISFMREDYVASADPEHLHSLQMANLSPEGVKSYEAGLAQMTDVGRKRQELAFQSFNVVLGAVLGFLSALAASFGISGPPGPPGPMGPNGRDGHV